MEKQKKNRESTELAQYVHNPGVAAGASLPKRAKALFGGRGDPLRFSGNSLKILRF